MSLEFLVFLESIDEGVEIERRWKRLLGCLGCSEFVGE